MQNWIHRAVLLVLVLLMAAPALAQEPETTPDPNATRAYYNSAALFGMPLPAGWDNLSEGEITHFSDGRSDIYVLAVESADVEAGIRTALERVNPAFVTEPSKTSSVNLQNGTWTQQIFTPEGGAIINAVGQAYDNRTFVLLFSHTQPDSDTYAVIVESADVQAGILDAAKRFIDADFALEATSSEETTSADGLVITTNTYTLDGGDELVAQGEVRGNFTYVVLERAPAGAAIDVNDAFFVVLLGFFVTPSTSNYLLLGLGVIALITLGFALTIFLRFRSAQQDLKTLEQIQAE
jgi:hypothetical protein